MDMRTRKHNAARNAFTLIEILIVVVILGILAAIVIPQFTNAADDANESGVKSQLQTLRSQIELYRAQNAGTNPASLATGDWSTMIDSGYLNGPPNNPMTSNNSVGAAAATTVGWVWTQAYWDETGAYTADATKPYQLFAVDAAGSVYDEYQ
jgi:prepilin-type N-terminal cleavage/methylation domain-containing protein